MSFFALLILGKRLCSRRLGWQPRRSARATVPLQSADRGFLHTDLLAQLLDKGDCKACQEATSAESSRLGAQGAQIARHPRRGWEAE